MQTIARSSEQYTNTIQRRSGEACDRKQRRCPPVPHDARHYTRKECPALCFYGRATIRITYIVLYFFPAAVAAEGMAGQLYAEAWANALADHLLRRYAACRQSERVFSGGFTPSKLQRTTAYI